MRLCLTGDVMTGRGVDQILAHPGDPTLHERWVRSALDYVALAERRSGPLPRGVEPTYVWGDALGAMREADAVIVNLETAVTDRGAPWPGKGIQYRMHPANVDVLVAAGVDVAVLANNHVLDWSVPGLERSLDVLRAAGIATAGAGRDDDEAWRPATAGGAGGGRALVLSVGTTSSGIPREWAAGRRRPGVALLPDLSTATVRRIAAILADERRPDDVAVVSIHWGGNWGYDVPPAHRRFAHALIDDAGVDVVHGHSSHHPLGIEVHHRRLVLHGCGDLLTDYEGISGHERYRGELGGLYLAEVGDGTGELRALRVAPTRVARFRLGRPDPDEVRWLASVLDRESAPHGARAAVSGDAVVLGW